MWNRILVTGFVVAALANPVFAETEDAGPLAVGNQAQGGVVCAAKNAAGGPQMIEIEATDANAAVLGTAGPDKLVGTSGPDVFKGGGGADRILGKGGNDSACGGGGKDMLKGKGGRDKLFGEGGTDDLRGGKGKDSCNGGPGKDASRSCEKRKSI